MCQFKCTAVNNGKFYEVELVIKLVLLNPKLVWARESTDFEFEKIYLSHIVRDLNVTSLYLKSPNSTLAKMHL